MSSQSGNIPWFQVSNDTPSPKSTDYDETDWEHKYEPLDRPNLFKQRPQRYSAKEIVKAVSDNQANKLRRKVYSSSEGDEEYRWDEENAEDEEDSLSISEDIEEPRHSKKFPSRSRRGTRLRSVDELQSGLRRSKRASRTRINYRDSEADSAKLDKSNASDGHSDASNDVDYSSESQDSGDDEDDQEMKDSGLVEERVETVDGEQSLSLDQAKQIASIYKEMLYQKKTIYGPE